MTEQALCHTRNWPRHPSAQSTCVPPFLGCPLPASSPATHHAVHLRIPAPGRITPGQPIGDRAPPFPDASLFGIWWGPIRSTGEAGAGVEECSDKGAGTSHTALFRIHVGSGQVHPGKGAWHLVSLTLPLLRTLTQVENCLAGALFQA